MLYAGDSARDGLRLKNSNERRHVIMGMVFPHKTHFPTMGMWTFDVRANVVFCDPVLALFFGFEDSEAAAGLPLQSFFDAIHPDDTQHVQEEIQKTYAGRSTFICEYRVFGRDGKWRKIIATGRCYYENGEPVQYPGFATELAPRIEQSKYALDELSDATIAANKFAAADKREFISYLLDMTLLEIGKALASRQVAQLMPKEFRNDISI